MAPSLTEWESFYVITGSSGAALTGLMFVVISLATERLPMGQVERTEGMSAYSTPTLIHFSVVLLIAAVMTIPHQTLLSVGIGLSIAGLVGIVYTARAVARMRRLPQYTPVAEDWIFNGILPFVAYVSLFVAALTLGVAMETAFFVVAGVVLLLLFVGIHNAWDVALYAATYRGHTAEIPAAPAAENTTQSHPERSEGSLPV